MFALSLFIILIITLTVSKTGRKLTKNSKPQMQNYAPSAYPVILLEMVRNMLQNHYKHFLINNKGKIFCNIYLR